MKQKTKRPCLIWWIISGVLAVSGLFISTYFYVRILPVGLAAVIVCYCLLFAFGKKHPKGARILRWIFTLCLIAGLLVGIVTGSLILGAGSEIPAEDLPWIIVLGAQVRDSGPSASLQERIDAAYEYLSAHPETVCIVSGGQGTDEPISESQCMYDCLVRMGISPERIRKEEQATSTWGNLTFSLEIVEAETGTRPASVGVVSSEYHLFRTGLQAKELDLQIIGIPAKTGSFDRWLHYFVREIAGVWHYLLLGGKNR
jgi:uncharacterized SAM-binding protein YcdF (DUF218 family)